MDVCFLRVLSVVRGLWVELITRPEESYRVFCVLGVIVEPRTGGLGPIGQSSHEEKIGNTDWQLRSYLGSI